MLRSLTVVAVMMAAMLILGGCPNRPKGYNMTVELDESLRGKTVEIDMFAVGDFELTKWKQQKVDEYFTEGSDARDEARRQNQAHTFSFRSDQPPVQTFSVNQWKPAWKGKENMVFIADLPGLNNRSDAEGNKRRLVLPLGRKHWETETIKVRVRRERLTPDPEPKSLD